MLDARKLAISSFYCFDKEPRRTYAWLMTKIYTKTGDAGETGIIGGKRVPKNHVRIEACGTIDEANAAMGLVISHLTDLTLRAQLERIQGMLFEIGVVLADPRARHTRPDDGDVKELELSIDDLSERLPELRHFILPGGATVSAQAHLARTMVRRAERRAVTVGQGGDVPPVIIRYLNRLSDYLFVLAQALNQTAGIKEKEWRSEEE